MPLYAHSSDVLPREQWHGLREHLQAVADMAAHFAAPFGGQEWALWAGLLHDVGKCQPKFQKYLVRTALDAFRGRSGVDHSTSGALLANQAASPLKRLLAYCIAGHHAGLPDGTGEGQSTLTNRLQRPLPECAASLFDTLPAVPDQLPLALDKRRFGFQVSFFTRMIFSCLVDADFLDTEKVMDQGRSASRQGWADLPELADRFFPRLEAMVQEARLKRDSEVNRIRREVLEQCLSAAELRPGLFSLTVPTGGGKTLSSLAFALRHAERHGKRRVIYVIPYMSIIEQNADVFRAFLDPDKRGDAVLEHHSSFDFEKGRPNGGGREDEDEDQATARAKRAAENWDAPVVVTTAVQFLESLFAARTSRCRKLHNIANSMVILDEAQMLPRDLLLPCLEAIRELALNYKTTMVLCTATQPAIKVRDDFEAGLENVHEIIHDPASLHQALRRVRVEQLGTLTDEELAERLVGHEQALCIVNTRGHARRLYERLKDNLKNADGLFHLSANMCPEHRIRIIKEIKNVLKTKKRCIIVSTSLLEAGVDISSPVVYRSAAGIDSIAQAAGRCDREGILTAKFGNPAGKVFVFWPAEKIDLPPVPFEQVATIALKTIRRYSEDILSPDAVEHYFGNLFWQIQQELDAEGILSLLGKKGGARSYNYPFKEIERLFKVIKHVMEPVIIPWDDQAKKWVAELDYVEHPGGLLRRLQRYTVQVSQRALYALMSDGVIELKAERYPVLTNVDIYRDDLGLCSENPTFRLIEGLIW